MVYCSGGSRPSEEEGGGGGGVSLPKKFFQPFGPHFGKKIREGCWAAHPSPGSTTSVLTWK